MWEINGMIMHVFAFYSDKHDKNRFLYGVLVLFSSTVRNYAVNLRLSYKKII